MSYDLLVFDVTAAPRDRSHFLEWLEKQSERQISHGWSDTDAPAPALNKWFSEIIKAFPPMNGPLASGDPDNYSSKVTDYVLGSSVISASFAWSEAEVAYKYVKDLATKSGVGFFDASGEDRDIWWPGAEWSLSCEVRGEIPLPLNLAFEEVLNKLDAKRNSFLILEHDSGNYMQCGGSKSACTVEFRAYESAKKYKHFVVGHAGGSTAKVSVKMSGGGVSVQKGEVLNAEEASEMFALFFEGKEFPKKYSLREKDV